MIGVELKKGQCMSKSLSVRSKRSSVTTKSGYEITEKGLIVRQGWTKELWESAGREIARYQKGLMWLIGDWLNAGDREGYVERGKLDQACERFGIAYKVAADAAWVSGKFESSERSELLDWSHHRVVAGRDDAADLIAWAEAEGATVKQLRERVREIKAADAPPLPEGIFSVIYADPPWMYSAGDQHGKEAQETVLSTHYPSMPIDELCELPVSDMAADDSVLFMWAVCPLLEDAMRLIEAWGFEYKAQMVWDKVKHNVGNYVSVHHELLLICTKGQPPRVPKLVDSVYSEERTEHSRKPEYFRKVIESMYPEGKRIELFRRGDAPDGWSVWGNEAEV